MGFVRALVKRRAARRRERALKQLEGGKTPGHIERIADAEVQGRTGYVGPRESDYTNDHRH